MSASDQFQFGYLRTLKECTDTQEADVAYRVLMSALEQNVMPQWTIFKNVVQPLLDALDLTLQHIAYTNIFKFHTATSGFSTQLFKRSWAFTKEQIDGLSPGVIVALGKGTYDQLQSLQSGNKLKIAPRTYVVYRHVGDTILPATGRANIAEIAAKEAIYLASAYGSSELRAFKEANDLQLGSQLHETDPPT